jgi:hypothetical protein
LYFATKEKLGIATERAFKAFSWPESEKTKKVKLNELTFTKNQRK